MTTTNRYRRVLRWGLGVTWLPVLAHAQQLAPPPLATTAAPLVFRGVTVIDVREGKRLPDRTVTIAGRRILAITPAAKAHIPSGARVVDAQGKYLIPGLWDMHVHPFSYVDVAYPLFLANGVTGVRDAGTNVPLATLAQWKREILAGTRVGPRHLVSGPQINADPDATSDTAHVRPGIGPAWHQLNVPPRLLRHVVDSLKAAGADFLKTYNLSRPTYLTVAAEARRIGIPFGGHVPTGLDGAEASDSGATFLDHETYLQDGSCDGAKPDALDSAKCAAWAARFRRNNTWITIICGFGANRPSSSARALRYLPDSVLGTEWYGGKNYARRTGLQAQAKVADTVPDPASITEWSAFADRIKMREWLQPIARMHQAGVPIVVGTDVGWSGWTYGAGPGFGVPEAVTGFVLAGFTPLEALQTATLNPAMALRATDSLGTVEQGKVADLVLLDGDPLADIWNVSKTSGVVANGRYYDRAALDQLLRDAEHAARVAPPPAP